MNTPAMEQLVRSTLELTGAAPPKLLDDDSPALRDEAQDGEMYLVGLIGGKDVGKSSLVNALVGKTISQSSNHGPGTEGVIAYAHQDRQAELKQLLDRETPGNFQIVTHRHPDLRNQVLLDLPDIDSRFADHVQTTRKMLRHMLFPLWIQSVEKYADAAPQNLLAQVAAGNDPKNFLFCLNKADQLAHGGPTAASSLREDYASRIARVLTVSQPPRVFLISSIHPPDFDLPELSRLLSQEKSDTAVAESRRLAQRRRQRSLLDWLIAQDLPARAARIARLEEEASELLSQRLGVPIVENIVPAILDDPAYRQTMTDGLFDQRVARWPVVNILHAALSPLRLVIRENTTPGAALTGPEALVDAHLSSMHPDLPATVQSAFAQLHQTSPAVADLYSHRKLWETMDAQSAAAGLRAQLVDAIRLQRQSVLEKLSGRSGFFAPLFRITLTIGAILWFPLVQPILQLILAGNSPLRSVRDGTLLLIQIMSTEVLLKNAVFLLLWHLFLWSMLRWDTRRRVDTLLTRWQTARQSDPDKNLTTKSILWIDDLLQEIRTARQTTETLANQIENLRAELE